MTLLSSWAGDLQVPNVEVTPHGAGEEGGGCLGPLMRVPPARTQPHCWPWAAGSGLAAGLRGVSGGPARSCKHDTLTAPLPKLAASRWRQKTSNF